MINLVKVYHEIYLNKFLLQNHIFLLRNCYLKICVKNFACKKIPYDLNLVYA